MAYVWFFFVSRLLMFLGRCTSHRFYFKQKSQTLSETDKLNYKTRVTTLNDN